MRKTFVLTTVLLLVLLGVAIPAEATPQVWNGAGDITSAQTSDTSQFWLAKPANTVEGDLLVAQIVFRLDYASPWIDTPSGWRKLSNSRWLNLHEMATFVKRAGPSEPSQYQFSVTGYGVDSVDWCGAIIRYTGASDVYGSAIDMGSGGDMVARNVNAPAGSVIQAVYARKYGNSMTPAASMTLRYHYYAHRPQMGIMAATEERTVGGLTGPRTATGSGDHWLAEMLVIYPADNSAPVVVVNPSDWTVTYGQDAYFYANVNGWVSPFPAVQWQMSGDEGLTWNDIPGATSIRMTLTRPPVAWNGHLIRCVFNNGIGDPVATSSARLTVNRKALTVTALNKSKDYDGQVFPYGSFEVGYAEFVTGEDASVLSGSVTYGGDAVGATAAGTHRISPSGDLTAANYSVTYADGWLTINRRPVTVTADAKSKVYGEPDPELTHQLTSGALMDGDAFSGAIARAAGESVGNYTIGQGTLTLGENYAITFVPAYLTIQRRPLTVTADAKTKAYGNPDPALTWQITSGSLVGSDHVYIGLTRNPGEALGEYPINRTYFYTTPGTNYDLTYVPANLTIEPRPVTITAHAKTKVYGNADPTLTYGITSGSLVSPDTFTGALTREAGAAVGSYEIRQGTVSLNANYTLSYVPGYLNITPRPITVTAHAKTKDYGDADPALTYQITSGSLVSPDVFAGGLTRDAGEAAGSYPIRQGSLALSTNYALTYVGANLTISPRPITIAADPATKTYGDPDPALTYQITSGSLLTPDEFTGALTRATGEIVGGYAIQQGTVAVNSSYAITFVPANLTISPKPVTVSADPASKTYGDADPVFTYQVTSGSLAFSDAFTGALARVAGEGVGSYAITQGTLALGANYTLSYVPANLTVSPRPVTVAADAKAKTYGDVDPALTYQITSGSLVSPDEFTGALDREAGENAGIYEIQQGSLALGGSYTLVFVPADLTISPRPITITADSRGKTYGDVDPALTYQITSGSLVSPDEFTGALDREAGENVGLYEIQQGSLALSTNYTLSYVPSYFGIRTRGVGVTADAQTKVYGDGDPVLTYQITSGSLAFSDEFTGAPAREAGEAVGSYQIGQGSLSLGDNYRLSFAPADVTISPRPVTVTAQAQTKVFGDDDPALTYQITSGSLAFSDGFTGELTREAGESIGSYAIMQGTLALGADYTLSYVPAYLTVISRHVTVTADVKTKLYGESDPVLTYQIMQGSLAFGDAFTGALTRVSGEAPGIYAILQGTLALPADYELHFVGANLSICYGITGPLAPYSAPAKVFKVGTVIPLKWQYTDFEGVIVPSSTADPAICIYLVDGSELSLIEIVVPGKAGLRYEAKEHMWVFNWSTKKAEAGLYRVFITSNETGQVQMLEIDLVK